MADTAVASSSSGSTSLSKAPAVSSTSSSSSSKKPKSIGAHYSVPRVMSLVDEYEAAKVELQNMRDHFKKNSRVKEYTGHSGKVHSVAWNCDGRRLASGSFDKSTCVFSMDSHKLRIEKVYEGHTDSVDQLCWHPTNNDLFATASGDKTVRIWDCRSQKSVSTINTKGENINIAWSPNGQHIAVGNKEDLVSFIDVKSGQIVQEEQYKFEVNEIRWDPTNKFFYVTNGDGHIQAQEYPSMTVDHTIKAHAANCICIEFHPSGNFFAVGSADAIVSLWNISERACIRTFSRLDWPVRALSFSYDGALIACASEDLMIDISHVYTGESVTEVAVEAPAFTVAWHPTKNILAYACDDKDRHNRDHDAGTLKLFGLPSDPQ